VITTVQITKNLVNQWPDNRGTTVKGIVSKYECIVQLYTSSEKSAALKSHGEKRCEIKGGSQEIVVMVII